MPARVGQELAAIADQAADRQDELHPDPAVRVGRHLLEPALPAGERLLDLADVVRRDVDGDPLVRLLDLAADLVEEDLRPGRRQLEALAAHLLDQDRQLELAAAADLEGVAGFGRVDLDRDVAEDLAIQAGLDLAARDVLALAAAQRRGVDPERHPERRRVDVEPGQRPRVGRVGERVADRDLRAAPRPRRCRPGPASARSTRSIPWAVWSEVTVPLSVTVRPGSTAPAVSSGSSRTTAIRWPSRSVPFQTRPTAIRPT